MSKLYMNYSQKSLLLYNVNMFLFSKSVQDVIDISSVLHIINISVTPSLIFYTNSFSFCQTIDLILYFYPFPPYTTLDCVVYI